MRWIEESRWRRPGVAVVAVWLLVAFMRGACAAETGSMPPDVLVRTVSEEVLQIARQSRGTGAPEEARVARLIEDKIAPHFDFARITRLAVGQPWRQATDTQRERLTTAFRGMLIRTYAAAYRGYREVAMDVRPVALTPGDTDALVRTSLKLPENPTPLAIDYSMHRTPDGWKVYDVAVAGASLVTTYRSGFGEQIRAHGLDGLIADLEARATGAKPARR